MLKIYKIILDSKRQGNSFFTSAQNPSVLSSQNVPCPLHPLALAVA